MKLPSDKLDERAEFALGDDGELIPSKSRKGKSKRKRGIRVVTRYGLSQALRQTLLIGLPISLLTLVALLQVAGKIDLHIPDGKLHLDWASQCSSIDNSLADEALRMVYPKMYESSPTTYLPDKSLGVKPITTNGLSNLFLMDSKETTLKQLTQNNRPELHHLEPQWSPDSKSIAFQLDDPKQRAVYVMDADGSNVRQLPAKYHSYIGSWSPDSKSLVYAAAIIDDDDYLLGLYATDIATLSTRQLTASYRNLWTRGVQWSPNGKWIAFSAVLSAYILKIENNEVSDLHLSAPAYVVMWTTDSKYLILYEYQGQILYAVDSTNFSTACRLQP
jgi:hypothetical protein